MSKKTKRGLIISAIVIVIVIVAILWSICNPSQPDGNTLKRMQNFNNPQGIITALETPDNKPKVTRELVGRQHEKNLQMFFRDSYTFNEDFQGKLYYPMVLSFQDLIPRGEVQEGLSYVPEITLGKENLKFECYPGGSLGSLTSIELKDWNGERIIQDWLSDGDNLEEGLHPSLRENKTVNLVRVNILTEAKDLGAEAPDFLLSFPSGMPFLTYGFNGLEGSEDITLSRFVDDQGDNRAYVIFFGDVPKLQLGGKDGASGETIEGIEAAVTTESMDFVDAAEVFIEEFWEELELHEDSTLKEHMLNRFLAEDMVQLDEEEGIFAIGEDLIGYIYSVKRIFYLALDEKIPAGETLTIERNVPASHNFSGVGNTDVNGYHILAASNSTVDYDETLFHVEDTNLWNVFIYDNEDLEEDDIEKEEKEKIYDVDREDHFTFTFGKKQ